MELGAEEGGGAHLVGGGRGARDGEQRPDAGDDGHVEDGCWDAAHRADDLVELAVCPEHGDDAEERQANVGHEVGDEAREPVLPALDADGRREDQVARAEEHGE